MSTDLPPEAYTRETLQSAFDWLQTQPDVVRASVHTPERLVSLFQKSQRLNDKDHPVSSKKFVTDLKNLATSLDQFSGTPAKIETPKTPSAPPTASMETPANQNEPMKTTTTRESFKKSSYEMTTRTQEMTLEPQMTLDPLTLKRLEEVQNRFNLGSQGEAMRMLVSLGYEKFSQFQ